MIIRLVLYEVTERTSILKYVLGKNKYEEIYDAGKTFIDAYLIKVEECNIVEEINNDPDLYIKEVQMLMILYYRNNQKEISRSILETERKNRLKHWNGHINIE